MRELHLSRIKQVKHRNIQPYSDLPKPNIQGDKSQLHPG